MNAILALGASHLDRMAPGSDYGTRAIVHRVSAIEGLNLALKESDRSFGASDSMIAACYALAFQATCMGDGMVDFLTMVRGCALVTEQVKEDGVPTAFDINAEDRLRQARLDPLPIIECTVAVAAYESLTQMQHLLVTATDYQFFTALLNITIALQSSSKDGYACFMAIYRFFFTINHLDFSHFIDPSNTAARLLLGHFIAIQLVLRHLTKHDWPEYNRQEHKLMSTVEGPMTTPLTEWIVSIFNSLPSDVLAHLSWPMELANDVRTALTANHCGFTELTNPLQHH